MTCIMTHQGNENIKDDAFHIYIFFLPSGSNDWKTLLACSDGDSGPTRDISCEDTATWYG